MYSISPEYFQAAGTVLETGRAFTIHDDSLAPRVAIVNGIFSRKVFGTTANVVGRFFKMHNGKRVQIVGVVQDGKYTGNLAEDPQPAAFFPLLQSPSSETWMVVRSPHTSQRLAPVIRNALQLLDAKLPAFIESWERDMDAALFAPRVAAASIGILGAMGVIVAITGILGLAAYSLSRQLRELGIRVALGAQRTDVLRAALSRAFKLLMWGSVTGLVIGTMASRVLGYIVYEATPRDPLVLAAAVTAMMVVGLTATWIPARRALSIDPLVLLREE